MGTNVVSFCPSVLVVILFLLTEIYTSLPVTNYWGLKSNYRILMNLIKDSDGIHAVELEPNQMLAINHSNPAAEGRAHSFTHQSMQPALISSACKHIDRLIPTLYGPLEKGLAGLAGRHPIMISGGEVPAHQTEPLRPSRAHGGLVVTS